MVPSHRPVASRRACSPSGIWRVLIQGLLLATSGSTGDMVAAGMNPASNAGLVTERGTRMVPSHRPVAARRACSPSGIWMGLTQRSLPAAIGRIEDQVAAGVNPAARATPAPKIGFTLK